MKPTTALFTVFICVVGIGVLLYLANYGLSTQAVPSLNEFIASSTEKGEITTEGGEKNMEQEELAATSTVSSPHSLLRAASSTFRIHIASTSETRERGLSGRELLESDEGLLFVFPEPGLHGFWMKDMNFPIDIVWIDSTKKIAGITKNISPESYPETFLPPRDIQFVLELNAGMAKKSRLATGTPVSF